jgi:hypothetical protein
VPSEILEKNEVAFIVVVEYSRFFSDILQKEEGKKVV